MKLKSAAVLIVAVCALAQEPALTFHEDPARTPRFRKVSHVVTFPPPNECVVLKVAADDEALALYTAVSRGGFSLKRPDSGLSVWRIDDWERAEAAWPNHCGEVK